MSPGADSLTCLRMHAIICDITSGDAEPMTTEQIKSERGQGSGLLLVVLGSILAAVLAATGFYVGAGLAQRLEWQPASVSTVVLLPTPVVSAIASGEAVDTDLKAGEIAQWQFRGTVGQIAAVEMWLHPGSGSSNDAELVVELFGPSGEPLAVELGSLYLPPFVGGLKLPETGTYLIRVSPTNGAPGRISLALSLTDETGAVSDATLVPNSPTPDPLTEYAVDALQQFEWPTTRRAISGWTFHDPRNPSHIGLDIAARMWDPIVAIADGVVMYADWGGGYGNLVIVDHQNGWRSYYAHFQEISVETGQAVRQGGLLGGAGTTGYSTGPHLHFEIRYQGRPVDPFVYLP